jgi:hypothetical protein
MSAMAELLALPVRQVSESTSFSVELFEEMMNVNNWHIVAGDDGVF